MKSNRLTPPIITKLNQQITCIGIMLNQQITCMGTTLNHIITDISIGVSYKFVLYLAYFTLLLIQVQCKLVADFVVFRPIRGDF